MFWTETEGREYGEQIIMELKEKLRYWDQNRPSVNLPSKQDLQLSRKRIFYHKLKNY